MTLYNLQEKDTLYPAFKENNFAVAFASDNNFVKYLSVAMLSLIKNCSNKYNYDIVILENNISSRNKKLLYREISNYKNVSLRFVDVQRFYNENKDVEFKSIRNDITITTYNRLFIPEIFKNYDKVLYLDCDIVVKGGLSDLYEMDLENNYIGAIVDMGTLAWKTKDNNSDNFYKYKEINAGVILFNIQKCIEIDFTKKCLLNICKSNTADQGAIDITCRNNIKYIDYRYNFFVSILDDVKNIKDYIPEYILNDIRVIHFTGAKCWFKDFAHNSNTDWFYYFTKTPFFNLFTLIVLKFELFRYKICIKITKGEKQEKYIKKASVLGEILKNISLR